MYPGSFPPPPQSRSLVPRKAASRTVDPFAAVIGNATMLGIGYVLMRRPRLAAAALVGTAFFMFALAADPAGPAWRILLASWWAAMSFHAWWLTRGARAERSLVDLDEPKPAWRSRVFAAGVAVLVLLGITGLRFDASQTVQNAAEAHAGGDCVRASALLEGLDASHRIAHGPMTVAAEADLEACGLLLDALGREPGAAALGLETYMDHPESLWDGAGPRRAEFLFASARVDAQFAQSHLEAAFAQLSSTLEEVPGQAGSVERAVEGFFADLAGEPSCHAKRINDWVYAQTWEARELTEPIAAAAAEVPERMLDCARGLSEAGDLEAAVTVYEQFLTEFGDHEEAGTAAEELYAVETAIEREHVDGLLSSDGYCEDPAPYRAAPTYSGKGPHAMWTFGINPETYDFPNGWKANDVDDTVLVTCVDGPKRGSHQESCYYEWDRSAFGITEVDFYASRFDVKVYELRTGEVAADYSAQIGDPCPRTLSYRTFPPSEVESDYTSADVRAMFHRLMD